MNFNEIQQFKKTRYSVDVHWSHITSYLDSYDHYYTIDLNPVYQRKEV